jgi:hypothetical protein
MTEQAVISGTLCLQHNNKKTTLVGLKRESNQPHLRKDRPQLTWERSVQ